MHRKGAACQSRAVALLLPSFHRDEKKKPCRGLGRSTVNVVKHALSSLIHADKIRPLTKCIFSLQQMAPLQEEPCEGSGAREVEHLPETWEIWVKCCVPQGGIVTGQQWMCWAVAQEVWAHLPSFKNCWGARFTGSERESITKTWIPLAHRLAHIIIRQKFCVHVPATRIIAPSPSLPHFSSC